MERASLKPYALITSLLRILIHQRFLQLYTHTPVTSITPPSSNNDYYTIHTTRGTIKTRQVVECSNAWIGHIYPEFQGKIIPTRGQVVHVPGKKLQLNPMGWEYGGDYLIQRPDTSIIFGGGRRLEVPPPSVSSYPPKTRFSNSILESREIGNADDTSINPEISHFLHAFPPTQFNFTKSVGTPPPISSIREWTGIMGYSNDGLPYVGCAEEKGSGLLVGFMDMGWLGFGCVQRLLRRGLGLEGGGSGRDGCLEVLYIVQIGFIQIDFLSTK